MSSNEEFKRLVGSIDRMKRTFNKFLSDNGFKDHAAYMEFLEENGISPIGRVQKDLFELSQKVGGSFEDAVYLYAGIMNDPSSRLIEYHEILRMTEKSLLMLKSYS